MLLNIARILCMPYRYPQQQTTYPSESSIYALVTWLSRSSIWWRPRSCLDIEEELFSRWFDCSIISFLVREPLFCVLEEFLLSDGTGVSCPGLEVPFVSTELFLFGLALELSIVLSGWFLLGCWVSALCIGVTKSSNKPLNISRKAYIIAGIETAAVTPTTSS